MQGLRERLFEQITAVLDPNEEVSPVVKTGAWKAVWTKASAFFSRRCADDQAQQELQKVPAPPALLSSNVTCKLLAHVSIISAGDNLCCVQAASRGIPKVP